MNNKYVAFSLIGVALFLIVMGVLLFQVIKTPLQTEVPPEGNVQQLASSVSTIGADELKVFKKEELRIQWYYAPRKWKNSDVDQLLAKINPEAIQQDNLFDIPKEECGDSKQIICRIFIYSAGEIIYPRNLYGQEILLVFIPSQGGYGYVFHDITLAYQDPKKEKMVGFDRLWGFTDFDSRWFIEGDFSYELKEFSVPEEIVLTSLHATLKDEVQSTDRLYLFQELIKDMPFLSDIADTIQRPPFMAHELALNHEEFGKIYFRDEHFFLPLPVSTAMPYSFNPSFLSTSTEILWFSNGTTTVNQDVYLKGGKKFFGIWGEGCSAWPRGGEIVRVSDGFNPQTFHKTGQTIYGEPLYDVPKTHSIYDSMFDLMKKDRHGKPIDISITKEEFIADHPIFFYKDFLGNWRMYVKEKYVAMMDKAFCEYN